MSPNPGVSVHLAGKTRFFRVEPEVLAALDRARGAQTRGQWVRELVTRHLEPSVRYRKAGLTTERLEEAAGGPIGAWLADRVREALGFPTYWQKLAQGLPETAGYPHPAATLILNYRRHGCSFQEIADILNGYHQIRTSSGRPWTAGSCHYIFQRILQQQDN